MQNVILTGIPRSGLTVFGALADCLPNVVCLNEPKWQQRKSQQIKKPMPYCKWLVGDFAWRRMQLLNKKPVRDLRAPDGKPILDSIKDPRLNKTETADATVAFIREDLDKDFTLIMKHHALYTALLPTLSEFQHFRIIAVIRHPYDVIKSWQTLDNRSVASGKLPQAAKYWHEIGRISLEENDLVTRMVQIYDAFCQRYYELQEKIEIVRFEDIARNPMLVSEMLNVDSLSPMASRIEERPRILLRDDTDKLKEKIKKYGVFTREFYDI